MFRKTSLGFDQPRLEVPPPKGPDDARAKRVRRSPLSMLPGDDEGEDGPESADAAARRRR